MPRSTNPPSSEPSAQPESAERLVLRGSSGLGTLIVVAGFGLFLIGDAVVRRRIDVALDALPFVLALSWTVYLVLVRPCVILDRPGITVVNVVRIHEVPWASVDEIHSRFQVRISLVGGRVIRSWGAPTSGLDRPLGTGRASARSRTSARPVHQTIDIWRASHEPDPAPPGDVTSRWDLTALAVTAVLIAACAAVVVF